MWSIFAGSPARSPASRSALILWYFQEARTYLIAKSVPAGSSAPPPPKVPMASGRKWSAPHGIRRPRSWSSTSPQRSASRVRGYLLEPLQDRDRAMHRLPVHEHPRDGLVTLTVDLLHLLVVGAGSEC